MSIYKLGNNGNTLPQKLRMLADEYEALDDTDLDRNQFVIITLSKDGNMGCGGVILDLATMLGAIELAKLDLMDNLANDVELMH